MKGYKIKASLYVSYETWREFIVPEDITFKQLHTLIQKIFYFDDYHEYGFRAMSLTEDDESLYINNEVSGVYSGNSDEIKLNELFDENQYFLYTYDYGDNWEIIIKREEKVDYNNKTALITDYKGEYNPRDDIGGLRVFEEILGAKDNPRELKSILSSYELGPRFLDGARFEKKYKKGSRIRIN